MNLIGQCLSEHVPEQGKHESGHHMLAYVIKAGLYAPKGALRDIGKSRAPAAILGGLSPSEAHLHRLRGAQGHKGR